jgi:hypothetical protein
MDSRCSITQMTPVPGGISLFILQVVKNKDKVYRYLLARDNRS